MRNQEHTSYQCLRKEGEHFPQGLEESQQNRQSRKTKRQRQGQTRKQGQSVVPIQYYKLYIGSVH